MIYEFNNWIVNTRNYYIRIDA